MSKATPPPKSARAQRTMPEKWKCSDGRVLLIREMSDDHIANAVKMLRQKGYLSLRDWNESRPVYHFGVHVGEYAEMAMEQGYENDLFVWAKTKHSAAIDAFHLETAYRRRHGIVIKDVTASPTAAEQIDPVYPAAEEFGGDRGAGLSPIDEIEGLYQSARIRMET